jgi:acyl-CoA synthetase (NDP forming)
VNPISPRQTRARTYLDEHQAKKLLKQYQLPVVEERIAADQDQAVDAARAIGYPVAVKALGAGLQHKTERNLVCLNLADDRAVIQACRQIQDNAGCDLQAFLVQPMILGQREFLVGLYRDDQFGPVVAFGLGGVLTEALEDITLRLAPLEENDARDMIAEIRAGELLGAFRGEAPVDRNALIRILMDLSRLALSEPIISEVDINPLKVTPQGRLLAVDALVSRVAEPAALPSSTMPAIAPKDLYLLFYPRSIAFVGASAQMGKWGHLLLVNTISGGYKGDIYLVNPKGGTIAGRTVYPSLQDIPGNVDLAVVTVPAPATLALMKSCQAKKVRYVVIISSGFAEVGAEGRTLEAELKEAARKAGVLLLGPNTMGITNPHIDLFCTGSTVRPKAGDTAMVSQSGNLGTQLLAFAEKQGIGIRAFAGSGNEAMITVEDALQGFAEDVQTRTVLLYVESVKDGPRFFNLAKQVSRKKPIVVLKGGQTRAGLQAAASHTGALASDSRIFDAMCRQAGIVKVDQPMDLLDLAAAFSSLPLPRGPKTAIMTWGGGWGVVTADLCQLNSLEVPDLEEAITTQIDPLLPDYWSKANPVDMVGEPNLAAAIKILEILMSWKGCDAVINLGILGRQLFMERLGAAVRKADPTISGSALNDLSRDLKQFEHDFKKYAVRLMERYEKPVVGVSLLTNDDHQTVTDIPNAAYKAVFYETPERAVKALSKMVCYQRYLADR